MSNDIKFTANGVIVEGALGINEAAPQRGLHVTGNEIHSGGGGAGLSFSNRESAFTNMPKKGERWVWYASAGNARLWSGDDKFSVSANGDVSAFVVSAIKPIVIQGANFLGRTAAVRLLAQDLVLSFMTQDPVTKHLSPAVPEDKNPTANFALSHWEGDTLVINRDGGYTGGVRIDGAVSIGGKNVATELSALRAELDALKKKVG